MICNYGPMGNSEGKPQYIIGEPGSQCQYGTKKTSDGLCGYEREGDRKKNKICTLTILYFLDIILVISV